MCAAPALADDWVVRPVRLGTSPFGAVNVDVLTRGDGSAAIGYTLAGDPNLYLSSLAAGQPYFQHQASTHFFLAASFAADSEGTVYYAGGVGNGIRVGQDTGDWGLGLVDGAHPTNSLGSRTRLPAVAVDSHGVPAFAAADTSGQRVLSRFDVPSGTWQNQTLPNSATSLVAFVQSALAYTPDDRAVVAYINNSSPQSPLVVSIQSGPSSWVSFNPATLAVASYGVSVAVAPDGRIGVAFPAADGIRVATYDGLTWTNERVAVAPGFVMPHSLAVDADGEFALAFAPTASNTTPVPLHLARHAADGSWSDQTLPLSATYASLTFDAANNPYVGAFDGRNVFLAGTSIQSLRADDFTLDGTVTADDVPGFAQAIRHPSTYLATHAPLSTTADLVSIGDRNGDVLLTDADARAFIDSLSTSPLPGLPGRNAGLLAFDQADLDPAIGSGTGNFFGVVLSTGQPYAPGLSRADLTGTGGRIDAADVDALHAALLAGVPADPRFDLNLDGIVDAADLSFLVHDILGTTEGDANADGRIDADDFALVDRGLANGSPAWTTGDFNLDGQITPADYLLLDTAFAQSNGGALSPAFLATRQSQFGDAYVSTLLATIPEPTTLAALGLALLPLTRRRP